MKVGLFFGSFNPIHIGHLAIANYVAEFTDLSQIWMVVSPQSPFKQENYLLHQNQRYHMVELALEDDLQIRPSPIEFELPKPSYTIDSLNYLDEKYPSNQFYMILGSDNLVHLHEWKNYQELLARSQLYVYPRPGSDPKKYSDQYDFHLLEAPLIGISSSMIRESFRKGKDMRYFVPSRVYAYIKEMHFYEK